MTLFCIGCMIYRMHTIWRSQFTSMGLKLEYQKNLRAFQYQLRDIVACAQVQICAIGLRSLRFVKLQRLNMKYGCLRTLFMKLFSSGFLARQFYFQIQ